MVLRLPFWRHGQFSSITYLTVLAVVNDKCTLVAIRNRAFDGIRHHGGRLHLQNQGVQNWLPKLCPGKEKDIQRGPGHECLARCRKGRARVD